MTDIALVAGAYLVALGAFAGYAAALVRRVRTARSTRAAVDRPSAIATSEAGTPLPRR